MMIKYYSVIAG